MPGFQAIFLWQFFDQIAALFLFSLQEYFKHGNFLTLLLAQVYKSEGDFSLLN
jgi:hypothetical protein